MSRFTCCMIIAALAAFGRPAQAEVAGAAANGFRIRVQSEVDATPQQVYEALLDIAKWWDKNHTYSANAENLYIEAKPKGWFGEKLPDGGFVRHMEVTHLVPGKAIRMLGGLGPLQELGVHGALTIKLRAADDKKTELLLSYAVTGFTPNGLDKLSKPVDQVLTAQMGRLKAFVEK